MLGLITDRSVRNVARRNELARKGWAGMTVSERAEWMGDPFSTLGANLLPPGPYYSGSVDVKYRSDRIDLTATMAGTYLYAICIIGESSKFANKKFTLSVDGVTGTGGATPQIALYWHDTTASGEDVYSYAGASISSPGSVTFNTTDFPSGEKKYLAAYIYVTTHGEVAAGATASIKGVMFEQGEVRHEYEPYSEVVATEATKGAYNYSDLNRVERAVSVISDLAGLGLTTKTDWTMWDIPRAADMTRYLGNIYAIRDHYSIQIDLPSKMDDLTYYYANNIESVLRAAYNEAAAI
jgi:hypothetical protein